MKYPRIYAMLKRNGHTAAKAIEIIIDAKRKQKYAIEWIKLVRRMG